MTKKYKMICFQLFLITPSHNSLFLFFPSYMKVYGEVAIVCGIPLPFGVKMTNEYKTEIILCYKETLFSMNFPFWIRDFSY